MALTFVTSIPALLIYHPVLHDHRYILGPGHDTRIELAALLEVFCAIGGIGVAVVMLPILRRQSERLALGYVASRIVESTMICVGLISVLAVLTLRGALAASIGVRLRWVSWHSASRGLTARVKAVGISASASAAWRRS